MTRKRLEEWNQDVEARQRLVHNLKVDLFEAEARVKRVRAELAGAEEALTAAGMTRDAEFKKATFPESV